MSDAGVEPFLHEFITLGSRPAARSLMQTTTKLQPSHNEFSGYVFKMQANLDPKHRCEGLGTRRVSSRESS
jgi:peptide chain release factor 3